MRLLVMDTSTWALAVGIVEDGKLLGELNTNVPKNHSLRLMPAIKQLFKHVDLKPRDVDGIAVAHGPGSYTGVRIGVTTAKAMAWSLKVPLLGLSSLQVLAQNAHFFTEFIIPMFDARRQQIYTGMYTYDREQQCVVPVKEDRIQPIQEWLRELRDFSAQGQDPYGSPILQQHEQAPFLFIGDGAIAFAEQIRQFFPERARFAPVQEHVPRGEQLAYLAWKMWEQDKYDQVHQVNPRYLQLAEVEQKLAARKQQSN